MRLSRLSEGMPMTQSNDHRTRGEALPLVDEVDELLALVDVELAVDVADVGAHRRDGEDEGLRDVGRREAAGQKHHTSASRKEGPGRRHLGAAASESFACSARPARGIAGRIGGAEGLKASGAPAPSSPFSASAAGYPRQRRRRHHPAARTDSSAAADSRAPPARSTCGRETPEHRHKCASEYRKPRGEVVGHREHLGENLSQSAAAAATPQAKPDPRLPATRDCAPRRAAPRTPAGRGRCRTRKGPPPRRPAGTCPRETHIPQTPPP